MLLPASFVSALVAVMAWTKVWGFWRGLTKG